MLTNYDLAQFTGTQSWHRWSPLFPNMLLTDGVLYLAEKGQCFWLMDAIASHQPDLLKNEWAEQAQFWELTVDLDAHTAVLICREDSDKAPAVTQVIEYTDFDLDTIKIWVMPTGRPNGGVDYVLLLPSEY
jgi:hypothetical protein